MKTLLASFAAVALMVSLTGCCCDSCKDGKCADGKCAAPAAEKEKCPAGCTCGACGTDKCTCHSK